MKITLLYTDIVLVHCTERASIRKAVETSTDPSLHHAFFKIMVVKDCNYTMCVIHVVKLCNESTPDLLPILVFFHIGFGNGESKSRRRRHVHKNYTSSTKPSPQSNTTLTKA